MSGGTKIVLQGTDAKRLEKLKALAHADGDARYFKLKPIGGTWFVEDLSWRTDREIYPPLSFTAVLRQLHTAKRKKSNV